ncbi:hypothetical protein ARMGADRAFT_870356, partial [Armillaria gallica]
IQVPLKPFVYFHMQEWLAELLSRKGLEEKMDDAWKGANSTPVSQTSDMRDIFDGSMLQEFRGPDGKHFSLGEERNEGRYVFSLCIDFFNPLGNKQAGKRISIGAISLICLNLPPDIRYKPENIYLAGIVPGPSEPPLSTLNNYM